MTPRPLLPLRRRDQGGAAAIEFALVAMLMVVLLMGLLVFWRFFQVQQSLNRAAGDGARGALTLITLSIPPCTGTSTKMSENQSAIEAAVRKVITQHLEQSGLPADRFSMSGTAWTCPSVTPGEGRFSFDVEYTLPSLLGGNGVVTEPTNMHIRDRIKVHFQAL